MVKHSDKKRLREYGFCLAWPKIKCIKANRATISRTTKSRTTLEICNMQLVKHFLIRQREMCFKDCV